MTRSPTPRPWTPAKVTASDASMDKTRPAIGTRQALVSAEAVGPPNPSVAAVLWRVLPAAASPLSVIRQV